MKKNANYILIAVIAIMLLFLTAASLIKPDVKMSENENRYLTQAPKFDIGDILGGEFEEDLENYLSDQIIGRESWIKLTTGSMKLLGARDANGVFFLGDNSLAERTTQADFNLTRFRSNIDQLMELQGFLDEENIPMDVLIVPTAARSVKDKENTSTNFREDEAMDLVAHRFEGSFFDLRDALSADKGSFYYATDHHWNYEGAETAASEYLEKITGKKHDFGEPVKLTDDFRGTLYSKVLLEGYGPDEIYAPGFAMEKKTEFTYDGESSDSIFFMDRLENKDKYEVFLGGNYGRADIEIKDSKGKPRLLMVKDSYANSFIPFLLDDFSEITMVDTRYFRGSVKDLAIDEGYDRVLILYSVTNFSQEKMALTSNLLQ